MLRKHVCMQQGDMLAVSPYESHHDPRFFHPHPARYDPTRGGLQCPGSSLHEVPGISGIAGLVFGGGRYRSALTLRHPRQLVQHHINCKQKLTMQRRVHPLFGQVWKSVVLSRCVTDFQADPHSGFTRRCMVGSCSQSCDSFACYSTCKMQK